MPVSLDAGVAQWLEHLLAMQKVVSSNLITRSKCFFRCKQFKTNRGKEFKPDRFSGGFRLRRLNAPTD